MRPDVSAISRWLAAARRSPSLRQRASAVYTGVVVAGIVGVLVYGTASSALADVVDAGSVARWGPSLMALSLLGAGYWGAVQGPVVFSAADVAHLVAAPVSRRDLVARPLRRALLLGACAGAVVAGVLVVGLTGRGRSVAVARVLGLVAGLGLAGVAGVALALTVSLDAGVERRLRLISWPAVAVAGALALGAGVGGGAGRTVALWSGPWGWAIQAGAGRAGREWVAGLAAMGLATVLAVVVAWRRRGDGETERFVRRAEGRANLEASLMAFDLRSSRRNLTEVASAPAARHTAGTRWLRDRLSAAATRRFGGRLAAECAVVWRNAAVAAQLPRRLVPGVLLAAGGAAFVLLDLKRPTAVVIGAVLIYVAAASLLEPMRIELDAPGRAQVFLGVRPGRAILAHTLFAAVLVSVAVGVCAGGLGVAGLLSGGGEVAAALALVATAPAVTACAGASARRGGRLPQEVLFTAITSDPSGGGLVLIAWLAAWPAAAAAIVYVPVKAIHAHSAVGHALVSVGVGLVIAAVAAGLARRDPRSS